MGNTPSTITICNIDRGDSQISNSCRVGRCALSKCQWRLYEHDQNKGNYNVCYKYKPNSLNIVKYSFSASLILILLFPILIKLFRSREDL